ncbi:hypothetical protein MHU86_25872 [Fragilaria crotonensis]|nr:hypothetical protein MHU86_25872 [Fragilaria crotonensis]
MNSRTKAVLCFIFVLLFEQALLGRVPWTKVESSRDESLRKGRFFLAFDHASVVPPTKAMTLFCVPWTMNTDDWWTNAPNWDVAEENDMFTCFRKTNHTLFLTKIYQNQFRYDCSRAYTQNMRTSSLAGYIESLALNLQGALKRKAPLTISKAGWDFLATKNEGSDAACSANDMSCYVSTHHKLPSKQKQWLRKRVYDIVKPILSNLTTPCSVVDVRRTNVTLHGAEARTFFPIADYVKLLPNTSNTVLLLTDDVRVIDRALTLAPSIRWVVVDVTLLHRTSAASSKQQTPSVDTSQEVVTILSILKLLRRCSTLFQSQSNFASEFGRAMELFVSQGHVEINRAHVVHNLSTPSDLQLTKLLE